MLALLSMELLEKEHEHAKRAGDAELLAKVQGEIRLRLGTLPGSSVEDPADRSACIEIVDLQIRDLKDDDEPASGEGGHS